MAHIEYVKDVEDVIWKRLGEEFEKYSNDNGISCNYSDFSFLAREDEEVIGIIAGCAYYEEVYIRDLIVYEGHRHKHIGTELLKAVEEYYKDKGYKHMSLNTYHFQAPEFYKKHGFQLEFIRESKEEPRLNRYFYIKHFGK